MSQTFDEIRYAPHDAPPDDKRAFLLWLPGKKNGRCLFFVHGGGWSAGSKEHWSAVADHFCDLGYVCVSAGYRLTPEYRFPAQFEDVRLAYSIVKARAEEWGFDPQKMAAWGSSAGAHLVAMLATTAADDDLGATPIMPTRETRPAAAVCLCPVFSVLPDNRLNTRESIKNLLGGEPQENLELARLASPIERVTSDASPFVIINGDADDVTPLEHQEMMMRVLNEHNVPAELKVLPGVGHGYGYGVESDAQKAMLELSEQFLEERLA